MGRKANKRHQRNGAGAFHLSDMLFKNCFFRWDLL